jgi:hypothetical protein
MVVKLVDSNIPSKAYTGQWFDASATIHAEQDVENMGIGICYSGDGDMYTRLKGGMMEFRVPRCDIEGTVMAFYYPGKQSRCTTGTIEFQCRYTATGRATLRIVTGFVGKEGFYVDEKKEYIIEFSKQLFIEMRDLAILAPVVAVPTGIGVATKRTGIGLGIGVLAAGAYMGYKIYRQYRV